MLSLETESLICKLLLNIVDGEKNVEIIRQVIADQEHFDPYIAFRVLDQENKGFLNENNFINFLK